nr:MAG TPA: hypothetical protein [Caudoviricetes sp.]
MGRQIAIGVEYRMLQSLPFQSSTNQQVDLSVIVDDYDLSHPRNDLSI